MARKRELTWHKARKCYRKMHKGKTHYLKTRCRNKSDDDGYRAALKEWQAVKAHAVGEGPEPYIDGEWNPDDYAKRYARWLVLAEERGLQPTNGKPMHVQSMATDYTRHAFTPGVVARLANGDITIGDLVAEYLRQRKVKAEAGKLSVKQYAQDKAKLADFIGFCKRFGKEMLTEINGPFLAFYRECQEALTAKTGDDGISGETARKRLQTVLKLWRWAYQQEYLDRLPRVLESGSYAQIKIDRPKPVFWEPSELRKLFDAASRRTKLYLALAANCGYTQAEISTLTWEMVDRKNRTIKRQRPKSEQTQVHVLWPITYELLCAESKSETGLCLIGQKGNELLTQTIKDDGNITHTDAIRHAFERTLRKTKLHGTGRTFKHIRKTSAQAIRQEYEDDRLVDMFLAHSTNGQMREHYTEPVYARYFEALEWLASHYGFVVAA